MTNEEQTVINAARAILSRRVRRGAEMSSPTMVRNFLILKLGDRDAESFCVLFLDNRHRVIEFREMFQGTIDGAGVYPREVVKTALQLNSAAVILAHNHPSGVAEPSVADEMITKRLQSALALVDIRTLDHCIVAGGEVVSLAERGIL